MYPVTRPARPRGNTSASARGGPGLIDRYRLSSNGDRHMEPSLFPTQSSQPHVDWTVHARPPCRGNELLANEHQQQDLVDRGLTRQFNMDYIGHLGQSWRAVRSGDRRVRRGITVIINDTSPGVRVAVQLVVVYLTTDEATICERPVRGHRVSELTSSVSMCRCSPSSQVTFTNSPHSCAAFRRTAGVRGFNYQGLNTTHPSRGEHVSGVVSAGQCILPMLPECRCSSTSTECCRSAPTARPWLGLRVETRLVLARSRALDSSSRSQPTLLPFARAPQRPAMAPRSEQHG